MQMACIKAVNESNSQRRQLDPHTHILLTRFIWSIIKHEMNFSLNKQWCCNYASENFQRLLELLGIFIYLFIFARKVKYLIQITTYWMDLPHRLERAETQHYDKH